MTDEVVARLREDVADVQEWRAKSPTSDPRHMGKPCPYCLSPIATSQAYDELEGGDGTNLCWQDQTCGESIVSVPVALLAAWLPPEAPEAPVEGRE